MNLQSRLNGLLIADQIRHAVAVEMRLGTSSLPNTFQWPALHFGWTLADVVRNSRTESKSTLSGVADKSSAASIESKEGGRVSFAESREAVGMAAGDSDPEDEMSDDVVWDEDEEGDMGKMAQKLMHKLSIDERMAKKKSLEIGTWNNDMAAEASAPPSGGTPGSIGGGLAEEWGDEENEDDELELAGIELPDNLTFLSSNLKPSKVTATASSNVSASGTTADWGTGIESKNFRVGSPTCFSSGNAMAGLMDDLEGFSCSDSEDGWDNDDDDASDGETDRPGRARIEFHGENLAETIEEETETAAREERQAKDRDQEASMVQDEDWDPDSLPFPARPNLLTSVTTATALTLDINIVEEEVMVKLVKPSDLPRQDEQAQEVSSGLLDYKPLIPELKDQADLDNVLANLSLAPNLSVLKARPAEESGVIAWPEVDQPSVGFDHQPDLEDHPGPSPSVILQVQRDGVQVFFCTAPRLGSLVPFIISRSKK